MSLDYYVFCADDRPISIVELAAMLGDAGWSLRVVRDWLGPEGFHVVEDGGLTPNDLTIGWLTDDALSPRFDAALRAGDREQIECWFRDFQLGKAMWSIKTPFDFDEHADWESLADAREQMGDQYANHLARTTRMYHAMYPPLMEFTAVIMGAVALLRDGMVEDPQNGSYVFPPSTASDLARFLEQWPTE